MTRTCVLVCLLVVCAICQAREEISLNGAWEAVKVSDLTTPPADGWKPFSVPGTFSGGRNERAWFRRTFTVPESMRGQRIELHFGGVKYNSVVRVNGQKVGGYFGGYDPFDVDITAVARIGEDNLLELGCCDWTGVMTGGEMDLTTSSKRPVDGRSVPKDKLLAPVGGLWQLYGPWDEIKLRAHPAVYIKDLFIKPSWRNKQLRVEYTLANQSATASTVTLSAAVEDHGAAILQLPSAAVTIAAGAESTTALTVDWSAPRCWSPEDPYLYFLASRLSAGDQPVDELRTRFGFRELWTEGPRFVLNGVHITFLATSWWPPREWVTKDYIQDQIRRIKAANCVAFRTHTQPWPEIWYETADEMGLMMIPEGAVWNDDDTYRVNDPVFWDNYATHLHAMVNREKNRPSTVMYSLENEFYGGRANDKAPCKADLVRMGELVHQWDPTRPFMYESDGDPGGVAPVVGIHYPHEYPQFTQWPNTAYWMDEPKTNCGFFTNGSPTWVWDRAKPLYIGEFLWIPSSDPSWDTDRKSVV
jgi:beta-galactosidase